MTPVIPVAGGDVLSGLQSLANEASGSAVNSAATKPAGDAQSFSTTLKTALDQVDSQIAKANGAAMAYAAGDHAVPLSSVMVSLEKANLAFQTAVTVRDRVTEAYNNIMNMPV